MTLLGGAAFGAFGQTIAVPLFSHTNTWRYNQTANLDGVQWMAAAYDDSLWPEGRGVLALEDTGNAFVIARTNTILTLGRQTYYFRTRFNFPNAPVGAALNFTNLVDDGAVFYLNGREIHRAYMPAAQAVITYGSGATTHEATGFDTFTLAGPVIETNLITGTNVLAVEVHQPVAASSDIVFGLGLSATVPDPVAPSRLRMPLNPPTYGYTFVNAFGAVGFANPVAIATPPGETNRVFVVEQDGIIAVITNLAAPTRTVFLNKVGTILAGGEEGLLGLAFHPGYASNRQFYIFYTVTATSSQGAGRHDRLSMMRASAANPAAADTASETILFEQFDQASNHNGGDLHFGPDGYLYISLGDEGNGDDSLANSQRIDKDFYAGLMRIDVDLRPGNLMPTAHPANTNNPLREIRYRIPADNPWVGSNSFNGFAINPANLRAEFWAVGLRNPWRFSFDTNGDLYLADVGQNTREEVNLVRRGGNYGWNYREGLIARPGSGAPPAGVIFDHPIVDYGRGTGTNQGTSVTGGVVYRGTNLPALHGAYIFADYLTPNVWMLRANGTNVVPFPRIAVEGSISGFGHDPRNGDVLIADQSEDTIKRLVLDTTTPIGNPLPPTLFHTGAFTNLHTLASPTAALTPNTGMVPYDLNVPFWSDNALKTRWFQAPTNQDFGFAAEGNWTLPSGLGWVKHFDLELTNGVPSSRVRLETRILVKNAAGLYGVTYRWGSSLTNATLVPDEGLDEPFVINDAGTIRTQVWHYPGRGECLQCHTSVGGHILGFNTPQLNRDFAYAGGTSNQLDHFRRAGYFTTAISNLTALRSLAPADDESSSLEWRVRSYLAANCAQCHQPGGTGLGNWNAALSNTTEVANIINALLVNNGGDPANRTLVFGDVPHSMIRTRMALRGPGQMPPRASSLVDTQGLALITRWIQTGSPGFENFPQWQMAHFGSTNSAVSLATADPDGDGANNYEEYATYSDPNLDTSHWGINNLYLTGFAHIQYDPRINRAIVIEWATNLGPGAVWRHLDMPLNTPHYPAFNLPRTITDTTPRTVQKFYRGRVSLP